MLRFANRTVALAGFCAAFLGARTGEDIAYVVPERIEVVGLAQRGATPTLAEVFAGCAVRVFERKQGMARVSFEGWVAEDALASSPPWPGEKPESPATPVATPPPVEPARPPSNEPVADLALSHHVGVRGEARGAGDAASVVITADLRTLQGRPVVVAGSKQPGQVTIFSERRVAGTRVRGDLLLDRAVTFVDGTATLEVAARELAIPSRVRTLMVSVRADLPGERSVHGSAVDVAVSVAAR